MSCASGESRGIVDKTFVLNECAKEAAAQVQASYKRMRNESDVHGISGVNYAILVWGGRNKNEMSVKYYTFSIILHRSG